MVVVRFPPWKFGPAFSTPVLFTVPRFQSPPTHSSARGGDMLYTPSFLPPDSRDDTFGTSQMHRWPGTQVARSLTRTEAEFKYVEALGRITLKRYNLHALTIVIITKCIYIYFYTLQKCTNLNTMNEFMNFYI